jgi:ABC-2 type transport system ATP-binding protein
MADKQSMNHVAIRTEGLTKTYKGKKGRKVEALKDLNLEVKRGEVFGLLGPNGAGKSTTIKLLMGLIFPDSGSFYLNGIDGRKTEARVSVGYLPENPAFYDYLTAEELLDFVGRNFGLHEKTIREKTEELLNLLDLKDARTRPIRTFSKGMVQRLGLAQCLIHDPELLILDEPMSGLDPIGRILVKDIIMDLKKQGKTVFMSTHILNDLEVLCDRVGIIVKGSLRTVVDISELMTKGIESYSLLFSSLSEESEKILEELGAIKKEGLRYIIDKDRLPEVLASMKEKGAEISLVEPVRKGLEDLFREFVEV